MEQEMIGKFISACRKEKGLTQMQLAEKLNITNRAVSKWETGKSMPDVSLMLDLCSILGITVNELLSGERIIMEDYQKRAEENLMELQAKKEKAQGELNSILKILIVTFSSFFVLNIVLNYFFPEINFNNLLGRTIYRHRARRIGSVMTVICRFLTSIKVSCLHLGQYSG